MARSTLTDEAIVHQYQATADPSLIAELVYRHQANVIRRCRDYVKDHDTVKDLSQEVFLCVLIKLEGFRGEASFATWLQVIVRNRCVDHLRRDKTALYQNLTKRIAESLAEEMAREDEDEDALPTPEVLHQLMEQISGEDKFLLLAKYREGWSVKEIEQVTGLSASTIKTRLHRIKARLRKLAQAG